MSQQVLEKLFDSPAKLRLLKLFLRNPEDKFALKDLRKRTLLQTKSVNKQLKKLLDIKFVKRSKRKGSYYYYLNQDFAFLEELQNLILKSSPADQKKMLKNLKGVGRIKLAVLSGVFIKTDREDLKTDLLIVGSGINNKKLESFIKNLEAEAGTELYYTVLTNDEFQYRHKMFDRFILDILEKPHKKLINKLIR
ncbi:MAG: hypothetical protein R3251_02645 [Candidatus Spechtbacterales bacterium]|nr:hypothetical protein [Candidatus Spechtbacterales bacterium]